LLRYLKKIFYNSVAELRIHTKLVRKFERLVFTMELKYYICT
jgi:hypothetical protein